MFDVAIVGGGASGLLTAIHLLHSAPRELRIALIEKSERVGEGIAYSTARPEHLLNVTAGRMSAFDGDPTHFVRWLNTQVPGIDWAGRFAERRQFARYLRATLDEVRAASRARLDIVHEEIIGIAQDTSLTLTCRSGRTLAAESVILALGNWPRTPAMLATLPENQFLHGWNYDGIAAIGADERVLIVGSGLSMVDAVVTLDANGHRAPIHVVSRHGLFPLGHVVQGHVDIDRDALTQLSLARRTHALRTYARDAIADGKPWQWVMDTLRPHVPLLWQTLSFDDQRRFLRHVSRFWDVHRHRVPASAAATIERLELDGRLLPHRGRISDVSSNGAGVDVQIVFHDLAHSLDKIHRVIDCTGLQSDIRRVSHPLLKTLLLDGTVRPGRHAIGIDTDEAGRVIAENGAVNERVYTMGSARIGQRWESVAIPELRLQAQALSARFKT